MMLDHLGHPELGDRVRNAIAATIAAGVLSPDLGGSARTTEVTDAIITKLRAGVAVG